MKAWWWLGVVVFWGCLAGCASEPEPQPPAPSVRMAEVSGVPLETLQQGRAVYLSDCTRCHEAMMPEDVSRSDWHVVVPGMAWNAGITAEEEADVLAYILASKRMAELAP